MAEKNDADKALTPDRIEQFLPDTNLAFLKTCLSNDELWMLATLRQVKEHGFGQVTVSVREGEVTILDTTERRQNLGELQLSMS